VADEVLFEARGHCAIITLNRPEARNALNRALSTGLSASIDRLESDPELWVGILAGAPPVFCAGADLKEMASRSSDSREDGPNIITGFLRRPRAKPMIAAVEGPAVAGGFEVVLACDLVVASRNGSFGVPEVKRSLVAAAGGLFRLGRKIPENIAMECILTGDPITAARAFDVGLVNELVEPGRALEAALTLAERICANAPVAVRASRAAAFAVNAASEDAEWDLSHRAFEMARCSEDFEEGVAAFVEKRSPNWVGQ
jgi:enoyl-CoA hydratase